MFSILARAQWVLGARWGAIGVLLNWNAFWKSGKIWSKSMPRFESQNLNEPHWRSSNFLVTHAPTIFFHSYGVCSMYRVQNSNKVTRQKYFFKVRPSFHELMLNRYEGVRSWFQMHFLWNKSLIWSKSSHRWPIFCVAETSSVSLIETLSKKCVS